MRFPQYGRRKISIALKTPHSASRLFAKIMQLPRQFLAQQFCELNLHCSVPREAIFWERNCVALRSLLAT